MTLGRWMSSLQSFESTTSLRKSGNPSSKAQRRITNELSLHKHRCEEPKISH